MKIKQKERGITLVALIVTIIVLVILSAVTIYAVVELNIVGVATKGTEDYTAAQIDDLKEIDAMAKFLESAVSNIVSGGGETPPPTPPVELPEAGTAVPTEGWSVEVAKGLVARDGLKAHLGEIVDYNPPAGGTWRIFYYDNEDQGNGKGYFGDPVGTVYLRRDYDENTMVDLSGKASYLPLDNGARFYQHNPLWAQTDDGEVNLEKERVCSFLTDDSNWREYLEIRFRRLRYWSIGDRDAFKIFPSRSE